MKRLYVVVDMQNDFITGALANPSAQKIVKPMTDFLKEISKDYYNSMIVATRDTHDENYLNSYEGKNLPIPHCIKRTLGWEINSEILNAITKYPIITIALDKKYFNAGENEWQDTFSEIKKLIASDDLEFEEIVIMGTCTDICVISNAFSLKALYPNIDIIVLSDLCAGLTKEKHESALDVMRSCQFKVMTSEEFLKDKK